MTVWKVSKFTDRAWIESKPKTLCNDALILDGVVSHPSGESWVFVENDDMTEAFSKGIKLIANANNRFAVVQLSPKVKVFHNTTLLVQANAIILDSFHTRQIAERYIDKMGLNTTDKTIVTIVEVEPYKSVLHPGETFMPE